MSLTSCLLVKLWMSLTSCLLVKLWKSCLTGNLSLACSSGRAASQETCLWPEALGELNLLSALVSQPEDSYVNLTRRLLCGVYLKVPMWNQPEESYVEIPLLFSAMSWKLSLSNPMWIFPVVLCNELEAQPEQSYVVISCCSLQ